MEPIKGSKLFSYICTSAFFIFRICTHPVLVKNNKYDHNIWLFSYIKAAI